MTWLGVTILSQHPSRACDRLRQIDPYGIFIPNWRFFAPNPAVTDYVLAVRYRDSKSSEVSDWYRTNIIPGRRLYHALLFPDRRINKSLHDSIGRILLLLDKSPNAVPNSEDYKIIARFSYDYLTKNIKSDFDIFQFLIATDTGYDETQKLNEIYLSRGEKVSKYG